MALEIVETYEYAENGQTYVYTKYQRSDGGYTIDRHIKSDPPSEPSEPAPAPVTNEDIMAKLEDMQGEQIGTASLDAAYQEGVNAVQYP